MILVVLKGKIVNGNITLRNPNSAICWSRNSLYEYADTVHTLQLYIPYSRWALKLKSEHQHNIFPSHISSSGAMPYVCNTYLSHNTVVLVLLNFAHVTKFWWTLRTEALCLASLCTVSVSFTSVHMGLCCTDILVWAYFPGLPLRLLDSSTLPQRLKWEKWIKHH